MSILGTKKTDIVRASTGLRIKPGLKHIKKALITSRS